MMRSRIELLCIVVRCMRGSRFEGGNVMGLGRLMV